MRKVAQEANRDYSTKEIRTKMVERLEAPARLAHLRPAEPVALLEVTRGSPIVDLGTGTGTLLEPLSRAVGPTGKVIAEDIEADFLDRARNRVKAAGLRNVDFVQGYRCGPEASRERG